MQFGMHRNRRLHTCFHSPVSLPVAVARLENPEGASAIIAQTQNLKGAVSHAHLSRVEMLETGIHIPGIDSPI